MYSANTNGAQLLLSYTDVFSGDIPNLKEEIRALNMHKAISIICELIRMRDTILKPITISHKEFGIPFETVLKKMFNIVPKAPEEMLSDTRLRKDSHIISVQMLLLLLKQIIQYGDYSTLNNTDYEISDDDYKKIVQLQLAVVEKFYQKHLKGDFDINHFLYSTYHLNYQRNIANEFLRMYYMLEKISRDKDNFDDDVKKEYKDYYADFTAKYGFTPTQYSSLLFGELVPYYSDIKGLTYSSMWRDVEKVYGKIKEKELISQIINTLSKPVKSFIDWAVKTEDLEWDFSDFFKFPFIVDQKGKYISVSDITLRNAFFEKIFWLIRDCYPENNSRSMSFFGRLFEKYIQDITQNATKNEYKYIAEFIYESNKKSSDAYIQKGSNLLVVEAKGYSVLLDCMTKNEQIERNNNKLFIEPILQADSCLSAVISNKPEFSGVEAAYIIAVTMDNINAVPDYYNDIHATIKKRKVCEKTKYFFNFSIEEYEMLMYFLEQGYDVFKLLRDYYNNNSLEPFSNYLCDKYGRVDMTTFMEEQYQEAIEKMKELLFKE